MQSHIIVDQVFGHFQNLNLIVLLEDLRRGFVTHGNWGEESSLCPVAHGVSDGDTVRLMNYASQAVDLDRACHIAAHSLHGDASIIRRFVDYWDWQWLSRDWLIEQ